MASVPSSEYSLAPSHAALADRLGDLALHGITLAAALAAVVLLGAIVWKVFALAWPAISEYGLGFLTAASGIRSRTSVRRAAFIYGTAVTSLHRAR